MAGKKTITPDPIVVLNDTYQVTLDQRCFILRKKISSDDKELSKELKVKVMRIRLAYNKVKKAFDEDVKEFVEQITTDEYKELVQKTERNEEEEKRFNELTSKINSDYIEFINQKGLEEVSETIDDKFTEDEYAEILDINSGNDVEINGNKIKVPCVSG